MIQRTSRLQGSKKKKDDEYYTLFQDIADELFLYLPQLRNMRICCPCDWNESYDEEIVYKAEGYILNRGLYTSKGIVMDSDIATKKEKIEKNLDLVKNQFIYFLLNQADEYQFKSISVSGYDPKTKKGVRFQDIDYSNYDVVITNPPFSIFSEFIDILIKSGVKFIVIGPQDAITLKPIIEHFQKDEIRVGYHYHLSGFERPDGTVLPKQHNIPRSCMWYTNMEVKDVQKELILTESYEENPSEYPKFVNYDAIAVKETRQIPYDYYGEMGVPITFIHKYNKNQFEIVGASAYLAKPIKDFVEEDAVYSKGGPRFYRKLGEKKYKREFERLVIKRKQNL